MEGPAVTPFIFYAPELGRPQQKQPGQFLTQPNVYHTESPQLLAPTPISFPSQLVLGARGYPLSITPSASPSLMEPYVASDICTESATSDMFFNPATPPLTHSGLSTPSIPYGIATPISNHGWSSMDEPSVSTVAPLEIQLPGTPMEYFPIGLITPTVVKSNASPPPSIAVNDVHCPALSPCSSQDSLAAESDFCDPRQITRDTATPVEVKPHVVFPPMPNLSGDDDEFIFGGNVEQYLPLDCTTKSKPYIPGDFNEELSDLGDSEDDFIRDFAESVYSSSKRVKYEDDSDVEQLPSPPMSAPSSREGSVAPSKPAPKRKLLKKKTGCEDMTEEQRIRSFKFGNNADDSDSSCCASPSDKVNVGIPINPNVIRRGRKQSLTEDPSKTFVCHLCNRRFRRQEHLKRHFRSLHTEDKPFSCGECGKRFSRSDNLTQHSRIHGTGAVVLGVLTEDDVPVLGSQYNISEEPELLSPAPAALGIVVVDPTATPSGDVKDARSSEDKKARRKRKRSDE